MPCLIWSLQQYNILMALIDKIMSETWARARLHGGLFSVHSDIWSGGQPATSKRMNDVGVLSGCMLD